MKEHQLGVRKELDLDKFKKDPITELQGLRPDSRVEQIAIDRLHRKSYIVFFLKKYVEFAKTNYLEELKQCGGPENLVLSNMSILLSLGCSEKVQTLWSDSIKKAKIFDYLLK